MHNFLDFEKPIAELEGKIEELRHLSDDGEFNIADEVALQGKVERLLRQTYGKLRPGRRPRWRAIPTGRTARLHPGPDRRLHAAGRRPRLRRGQGHRRRPRALPRLYGDGDRA
jgi:hypothetical protein